MSQRLTIGKSNKTFFIAFYTILLLGSINAFFFLERAFFNTSAAIVFTFFFIVFSLVSLSNVIPKLKQIRAIHKLEDNCINVYSHFNKLLASLPLQHIDRIYSSKKGNIEVIDINGRMMRIPFDQDFLDTIIQMKENLKGKPYTAKHISSNTFGNKGENIFLKKNLLLLLPLTLVTSISLIIKPELIHMENEVPFRGTLIAGSGILLIYFIIQLINTFKKIEFMEVKGDTIQCFSIRKRLLHTLLLKDIETMYINEDGKTVRLEIVSKAGRRYLMDHDQNFYQQLIPLVQQRSN